MDDAEIMYDEARDKVIELIFETFEKVETISNWEGGGVYLINNKKRVFEDDIDKMIKNYLSGIPFYQGVLDFQYKTGRKVEKVCKNCKYYECYELNNDLFSGYVGSCKFMPNPVSKCKFDWCGQFVEKPDGTKTVLVLEPRLGRK